MNNIAQNVELNLGANSDTARFDTRKWIVLILFFGSGVSGLVYEVVWSRMLTYTFGATLYAVATVLAAFMGGLALGSFLFGFVADKSKKPLRLYGILELGIGFSALALPFVLKSMTPVYSAIYTRYSASFFTFSLIRFGVTFLILLIPTCLMGATLPVLSRFIVRKKNTLGLNVGLLYALNTAGAVIGCFIAGFYLIANLGINGTIMFAAVINIAIAIASFSISAVVEKERDEVNAGSPAPESSGESPKVTQISSGIMPNVYPAYVIKIVVVAYFLSGFAALGYQVIWSRSLVFGFDLLKNTTYSFTAMLSVFLIGLAIGSAIISKFIDRQTNLLRLFAFIEILIGVSAMFSLLFILNMASAFEPLKSMSENGEEIYWNAAVFNIFAKTFVAIFLPTLMMGMTFPVVSKIFVANVRHVGEGIGKIYSVNTLGAIFGAFLTGFFIIPKFGIAVGLLLFVMVSMGIGLTLIIISPSLDPRSKKTWTVVVAVMLVLILFRAPKEAKFQDVAEGEKLLFYKEGPLATVSVKTTRLGYNELFVDNVGVAGTDPILLTDQKSLAHIPSLFLPEPKSALTVGFGSGGASYSYLQFDYLDTVDCVEISTTVPLAAQYLLDSNHGILELNDPRFRLFYDDVRSYLKLSNAKYDIIATDCTDLRYKTNANLYDFEYFGLCRDSINDDGMVIVWMPLGGLSPKCFKVALRTFYRVFPHMSVWYMNNEPTHYILLIGTKSPFKIDFQLLKKRLEMPKVKKDLAELYLDDPFKILSCFITDEEELDQFLEGEILNTENYPYLEFNSPKYGYGDKPLLDNLDSLMDIKLDVTKMLKNLPEDEHDRAVVLETISSYNSAIPVIIEGHKHYRKMELVKACESYMEALKINPSDRSVKHSLDFQDLKQRIKTLNDWWAMNMLGELYLLQERHSDALRYFKMVTQLDAPALKNTNMRNQLLKDQAKAYFNMGRTYIAAKRPAKAITYLENATSLQPNVQEYKDLLAEIEQEQE